MNFKLCINGNSNYLKMNINIYIFIFVSVFLIIYGFFNLEWFYFYDNMYKFEVWNY